MSEQCQECQGTGEVEEITWRSFSRGLEPCGEQIDCPECNGSGEVDRD